MDADLSRTKLLLGEENSKKLLSAKVAIFGLGGVGGTSFLSLVRSGIGNIVAVDFDTVEPSNLNRQMLFESKDIGKKKTDVAKLTPSRLGFETNIEAIDEKVGADFFLSYPLDVDFVIDAIDDVKGKMAIALECVDKGIPFVVCLGMGNRLDPSKVEITKLDKTHGDPLAKRLRKEFKEAGLDISKIKVAFSTEEPLAKGEIVSSMAFVPSEAGLLMASECVRTLVR